MSTDRTSILALDDPCKLADSVKLFIGDGADREDPSVGDASLYHDGSNLTLDCDTGHTVITSPDAGDKQVRINVKTFTNTSGDVIGFQAKPGSDAASGTVTVYGGQISPRFNDGKVGATIVGLHVDAYLKGTTGNLSGSVRGLQVELVDDEGSTRTVTGDEVGIRLRSAIEHTVTGDHVPILVEAAEKATGWEFLAKLPDDGVIASDAAESSATNAGWLKVKVGSSTRYINLFSGAPS